MLHPKAPPELSRFAFLIGAFHCSARVKLPDGSWQTFQAAWTGRPILDGYAIADEYRMWGPDGALVVLGMNFRVYDTARRTWRIQWLDGLTGTWTELGSEELGGVRFEDDSIVYAFREPVVGHRFTRAHYTNISAGHFTWLGEGSADGLNWREFMIIDADRVQRAAS